MRACREMERAAEARPVHSVRRMTEQRPLPAEFEYVDRPEGLSRVLPSLRAAKALAVDIEADSMHSFFEKVCLVQLATDSGEAYILDPLALRTGLAPLGEVLGDVATVKIFHGADFDVMSLRRDFGFGFRRIFDTMVASMLLGDEKLSLRDLVERFFGVTLEKAYTRSDWARRPLEELQLEYCYHDVAFLVRLMEIQRGRLQEADLVEEAEIEFERLALREAAKREFDPHGWMRVTGARELSPPQQALLAQLYVLRDHHARQLDRPPFKVIGNDTLLRVARAMPTTLDRLRSIKGVSSYGAGRMGREILAAVEAATARGEPPPRPRSKGGDPARRLDISAQRRLGRLKDWRSEAASRSKMTTMAVLPNYAMFEVAKVRPSSVTELAAIPGVGEKRAERWGKEILEIVR